MKKPLSPLLTADVFFGQLLTTKDRSLLQIADNMFCNKFFNPIFNLKLYFQLEISDFDVETQKF